MQSVWLLALLLPIAGLIFFSSLARRRRLAEIERFPFPPYLSNRLAEAYPQLTAEDRELVLRGLREFFAISAMAGWRRVAMPSRAVDAAWHEFILSTRAYAAFCEQVLGRFLHHTPAEAMASPRHAQDGIRHAWRLACRREGIHPSAPTRLPLLFALDAHLGIPNGFVYRLDCRREPHGSDGGPAYCASHIGGCSSDGGGSGSGCGGDGGGCGGD